MAREESAAERSLRELQEGRPSSAGPVETSARPSGSRGSSPRRSPILRGVVAVAALAVVAAAAVVIVKTTASDEDPDDLNSRFARSFGEASTLQAARGREAMAVVEGLEVPARWVPVEDARISMNESDGGSYAFYDVSYTLPADYTGEDFSTWFDAEDTVTGSDPDDVTCSTSGGGQELSCEVRFESEDADGSSAPDPPRQILTVTWSAASADEETNVAIRGYSTATKA